MQEFIFLIRSEGDCAEHMSAEQHSEHLQRVINYIDNLRTKGLFIGAQPLTMNGSILSSGKSGIKDGPFIESKEVIAGYFLIRAHSLDAAIAIASEHPLLRDDESARIEVREIKHQIGIN